MMFRDLPLGNQPGLEYPQSDRTSANDILDREYRESLAPELHKCADVIAFYSAKADYAVVIDNVALCSRYREDLNNSLQKREELLQAIYQRARQLGATHITEAGVSRIIPRENASTETKSLKPQTVDWYRSRKAELDRLYGSPGDPAALLTGILSSRERRVRELMNPTEKAVQSIDEDGRYAERAYGLVAATFEAGDGELAAKALAFAGSIEPPGDEIRVALDLALLNADRRTRVLFDRTTAKIAKDASMGVESLRAYKPKAVD